MILNIYLAVCVLSKSSSLSVITPKASLLIEERIFSTLIPNPNAGTILPLVIESIEAGL